MFGEIIAKFVQATCRHAEITTKWPVQQYDTLLLQV